MYNFRYYFLFLGYGSLASLVLTIASIPCFIMRNRGFYFNKTGFIVGFCFSLTLFVGFLMMFVYTLYLSYYNIGAVDVAADQRRLAIKRARLRASRERAFDHENALESNRPLSDDDASNSDDEADDNDGNDGSENSKRKGSWKNVRNALLCKQREYLVFALLPLPRKVKANDPFHIQ